jgi:hypothetical protein
MQVRSGYRRLWRAATETFRGDVFALGQARLEMRNQLEINRNATPEAVPDLLQALHDAEDFLSNNITQAKKTEDNSYRVELEDPHITGRGQKAVGEDRNLDFTVIQADDNIPDKVPRGGIVVESSKKG